MRRKAVTMQDIAGRLSLSVNAVSLALNDRPGVSEETRRQVLSAAEELGYLDQSRKYIDTYAQKNICVILKHRFFRDMRFYGRILLGIEEAAKRAGFDVFINSYEAQEIPSCVESRKVSGIIVLGLIEDDFLDRLRSFGIPLVLADHISMEIATDCVMSDNARGIYAMMRSIFARGYRRIGYFGGLDYSPSTRERFGGYRDAVQQFFALGSFEESLDYARRYSVLNGVEGYVIAHDSEGLYRLFQAIPERPEVLVCSNDELAILLMRTLKEHGIQVPEQIGIAGFDDIELGNMVVPTLTTVHVNKKLMGEMAVRQLINRMANPKEPMQKLVMDVALVERNSLLHGPAYIPGDTGIKNS